MGGVGRARIRNSEVRIIRGRSRSDERRLEFRSDKRRTESKRQQPYRRPRNRQHHLLLVASLLAPVFAFSRLSFHATLLFTSIENGSPGTDGEVGEVHGIRDSLCGDLAG